MSMMNPRLRALLRQAKKTADQGKRSAAERLYHDIVAEFPESAEGWLGLSGVVSDPAGRTTAYAKAIALDPTLQTEETPSDDPFSQTRAWLDEVTAAPTKAKPVKATKTQTPIAELEEEPAAETLVCYRHPNTETGLRCYSCNKPICIKCAKHTSVGYRCPVCIHQAEEVFFEATLLDYALVAIATFILSLIGGVIAPFMGFWVVFIAAGVGTLIGRVAFRVSGRRRGRNMPLLVGLMVVTGGLAPAVVPVLLALILGGNLLSAFSFGFIWSIVYVGLATATAYYQVK